MRQISLLAFFVLLTACAIPTFGTSPSQTPTQTQSVSLPTAVQTTPAPPTKTAIPLQVLAKQTVNVRQGPGLEFKIVTKLPANSTALILGKSGDGQWVKITYSDAKTVGWVSVAVVTVSGPIDTLQVIGLTPTSTATTVIAATRIPTQKNTPTLTLIPIVIPAYTPAPPSGRT